MKILICPDKFKGSLSALEVSIALQKGILSTNEKHNITIRPMADGGEGSLETLKSTLDLHRTEDFFSDPLGRMISASYYTHMRSAYIELASASGLQRLSDEEKNPLITSTRGTGEMILNAIENGANEIFLFVGGSATNDAGMGILSVLGVSFLDFAGNVLKPIGQNLEKVVFIDVSNIDKSIKFVSFIILTDVENIFCGLNGAAHIYSPQKGADEEMVQILDRGLFQFAKAMKQSCNIEIINVKSAGAAGGVVGGLFGILGAKIRSGLNFISENVNLEGLVSESELVITGEGQIDDQTMRGKVVNGVFNLAKKHNKRMAIVAGQNKLDKKQLLTLGDVQIHSIMNFALDQKDAMRNAPHYLEKIGKIIVDQTE